MKKTIFTFIVFAFTANLWGQLKVNSLGEVGIGTNPQYKLDVAGDIYLGSNSNIIGTTNNVPITFKVNNILAGVTGFKGNVSFGYEALNTIKGWGNTAVGYSALRINVFDDNTAIGYKTLYNNTGGERNTATGVEALYNNGNGGGNTAIGMRALYNNIWGWANTAIGDCADVDDNGLYGATAIGCGAIATESNQIVLGNYTVNSVNGVVNWTTTSDGRAKKNIQANVPGLAFIKSLQPVTYNFDLNALDELQKSDNPKINAYRDSLRMARSLKEKEFETKSRANKEKIIYSGFIAQDVEKAAGSIGYDFSGVDAPENGKGAYGLRYAEFVVPLVKAVQELSEQNDRLQKQVDELTALVYKMPEKEIGILKDETPVLAGEPAGIEPPTSNKAASLSQNVPNPFNQDTQISYYLPETVGTALLCFYDLHGKQLKQIKLLQRGKGLETIQGSQFAPGIYLYALIADGMEVDVKRMILTE